MAGSPSPRAAGGLAARFCTFSALFALLYACLQREWHALTYVLFTLPGVHEFVTLSRVRPGRPAAAVTIALAYSYTAGLVLAVGEYHAAGVPINHPSIEPLLWDRLIFFTRWYAVGQALVCAAALAAELLLDGEGAGYDRAAHDAAAHSVGRLALVFVGTLWGPGLTFFAALLASATSIRHMAFLIIVTQLQDNWQLVFGKLFGRVRPFPWLSPKKSVAGYAGGTVATCATMCYLGTEYGFAECGWARASALVVVLGITGDLSMSAVKRTMQFKDTGDILPGVGGLLDRMDSLLFVLPAAYLLRY